MYLNGLFFIVNNLLVINASFMLTKLIARGRDFWSVALISAVNYFIIIHFVVFTLGFLGLLSASWALTVLLVGNIFIVLLASKRLNDLKSVGKLWKTSEFASLFHKCLLIISLFLLFSLISIWIVGAGLKGTMLKWDDLSYHAALAAGILLQQKISLIPFTYQSYYPFNAELLPLWFMLPFGNDTYVSLSGLYWGLLGALSLFVVTIKTVRRTSDAALLASLFLSSNIVLGRAESFSANDLAGSVLIITAVTITMLVQLGELEKSRIYIFYSGLLSGLAIGCKVTFAPASLVILGWWLFLTRYDRGIKNIFSTLILFFIPLLLTGGYWYFRNLVLTGNPLFPAEFGPFAGPFDSHSQEKTKAWVWFISEGVSWEVVSRVFRWPYITAVIAGTGYFVTLFSFSYPKVNALKNIKNFEVDKILLILGLITIFLSPFLPFSGTDNRPYSELKLSPRYFILAFMCGLLLYRRLLIIESVISSIAAGMMVIATAYAGYLMSRGLNSLVALLGGIAGVLIVFNSATLIQRYLKQIALGFLGIFFVGLVAWYPIKQAKTAENLFSISDKNKPIGRVLRQLELLPAGSKVGYFMSEPYQLTQFYPIFGRQLQLVPVPLTDTGLQRSFLHVDWGKDYINWWQDWAYDGHIWKRAPRTIIPREFIENLRSASVNYVVTTKWSLGIWPDQEQWLKESRLADQVYSDGFSSIWHITK